MSLSINTDSREAFDFDAVLLDAVGTLIRPREPVGETYAVTARRFGGTLEAGRLTQTFGEVFREMPDLAFQWATRDELQHQERDWWRTLVRRVVARTGGGVGDFDGYFDALYAHYAADSAWECFREVPAVLQALRDRGCRIAVVSNFDSRLPGILQGLGISDRADAMIYSSEAGSAKPDPAIFHRALDALGVVSERAIHVGDSDRADLKGAVAAGIAGLLINRDTVSNSADAPVIRSLEELIDRIDRIDEPGD